MPHHQTYIAGVKFRPGASEHLADLWAKDEPAVFTLQPEPDNPHDPHAVKVLHGDKHLGYVPRDLAPEIGVLLAQGRISGVGRRGNTGIDIHYTEGEDQ